MLCTMWTVLLILCGVGSVLAQSNETYRLVNIKQGPVRGHLDPEGGLYTFYNVPYASAPTGVNRFKAPLPPAVWMHTFDAVDRGIICPQPGNFLTMQEDCLVANVFVPDTVQTNLTVVVVVHGGAYQYGFGNHQTINTLVRTNKIIAVTFNYRLGAHGFLCLGTEAAPGNAGLKDQIALLRWVNANIASFGGNPEDVTILGCSAAGGSVDILTLSDITTGLFNKAVMESGSTFGSVGVQVNPILNAQNYARLLNFDNVVNMDALEEFYTGLSFQELYSNHQVVTGNVDGRIWFGPCVERDIGEERVITDSPINIIRQGKYNKIPLVYGFANMEGLMRIGLFDTWKDKMNEKFSDFLPAELHFESEEEKERVAATVKSFYFGNQTVSEEAVLSYIDYFTDTVFAYPILKAVAARVESQNDTIYLHKYSFVDENTPSIPHTDEKGANHCEQTDALTDEDESIVTPEYRLMKATMREYMLNFILTGDPSAEGSELPVWSPANANRAPYMSLGRTVQLNSSMLLETRATLWDEIYEKHYRGPVPPPPSPGAANSLMVSYISIVFVLLTLYYG